MGIHRISPDSKWLAYSKTASNNFRRITVWSLEKDSIYSLTNPFADSFSPAWDLDGKHLYFLASTELALGSGWDFFPRVFRRMEAGPLIGTKTWGGLVASSVYYNMVDGGYLTAPVNAVFDPLKNEWVTENKGIAPDMEVHQDARSLAEGKDPQLERAVEKLLKMLQHEKTLDITPPPFSTPAKE